MESKTLFAFLLILQFTSCISKDTITINETLKEGNLLISKENKFALGFFSPDSSSSRYLGIWFHKLPGQSVVWVANRNNPIKSSSGVLSINKQGSLVLYSDNNPIWSTNVSEGREVKLLDSGNLVFEGENKRLLWQSFDYPTDTYLPGMKIGLDKKTGLHRFLTSWKSGNDPGIGNYSYRVNPSGSPQFLLYNGTKHYWRTSPWPWRTFHEVFDSKFVHNEDEIYQNYKFHDASVITRIILDHSGLLKWLTWHEIDGEWKDFQTRPKERCDFHGRCGAYGKCDSNSVSKFECTCLPGYEPKSQRDWNLWDGRRGCVRKRQKSSSICGHGEGFVKVENLQIPDTSEAVWKDMKMSRIDCEQECKRNCSCTAYSSIPMDENGSGCLMWYGDLIDTITLLPDISYDLFVRVDAIELAANATKTSSFLESKGNLSILIVSGVSAWLVLIIFIYFWLKRKKKKGTMKNKHSKKLFDTISGSNKHKDALAAANELEGGGRSHQDLTLFDLSTLLAATNNFSPSNKIGQGGFGTVYKGQLSNGQQIAIKRMSKTSKQGIEEFKNEVLLIAKLQHRNLVKLLGCCIEKKEQMLIYEYLPNKSLDTFLFDEIKKSFMNWERRFNIIVGIAHGILYLHQDSRLTIIHRDLKSSNVLLDAEMNPKISDFGMARLFKNDEIEGKTTRVVGTYGYMSPEYAIFGKYSVKSDVFSFGVILLEIVSGKKSSGFNQADSSLSFIGHVWETWNEGRPLEIVDSSLTESCNYVQVLRCIQIGLLCVQEDAVDRLTMLEVVLMLKSETTLPSPKQPAFIFKASSSNTRPLEPKETSFSINDVTITALASR